MCFYEIRYCYLTVLFNDKGQLLCYNVAVYILNQIEEDHFLILKAKPHQFRVIKVYVKKLTRKVKNYKARDYFDVITH